MLLGTEYYTLVDGVARVVVVFVCFLLVFTTLSGIICCCCFATIKYDLLSGQVVDCLLML